MNYIFKKFWLKNFKRITLHFSPKVAIKRTVRVGNKVSREFEILNSLKDCPNIVQLLDFFYSKDQHKRTI